MANFLFQLLGISHPSPSFNFGFANLLHILELFQYHSLQSQITSLFDFSFPLFPSTYTYLTILTVSVSTFFKTTPNHLNMFSHVLSIIDTTPKLLILYLLIINSVLSGHFTRPSKRSHIFNTHSPIHFSMNPPKFVP